jgi:hypothetical protein
MSSGFGYAPVKTIRELKRSLDRLHGIRSSMSLLTWMAAAVLTAAARAGRAKRILSIIPPAVRQARVPPMPTAAMEGVSPAFLLLGQVDPAESLRVEPAGMDLVPASMEGLAEELARRPMEALVGQVVRVALYPEAVAAVATSASQRGHRSP